mgnify:FL=1
MTMAETFIPIPVETITEAAELPSRTYRLDLEKGRIVGKVDGLAAVDQAIRKAIITPRFKCLIYDHQYGNEAEAAVTAKDATRDYSEATLEGFVKDALRPDTRILSISNFKMKFEGDGARVSFSADTVFGATEIEEVI